MSERQVSTDERQLSTVGQATTLSAGATEWPEDPVLSLDPPVDVLPDVAVMEKALIRAMRLGGWRLVRGNRESVNRRIAAAAILAALRSALSDMEKRP